MSGTREPWQKKVRACLQRTGKLIDRLRPSARISRINCLVEQFKVDNQNYELLCRLYSLLCGLGNSAFMGRLGTSRRDFLKAMIALEPGDALNFCCLARQMDDDETVTLGSGKTFGKHALVDLLRDENNQLFNCDHPSFFFAMSVLVKDRKAKEQYQKKCFDAVQNACEGRNLCHLYIDFAVSGCEDNQTRRERTAASINAILAEFGSLDDLMHDAHPDCLLLSPGLGSWHGNYTQNFRRMLPNLYHELAFAMEDTHVVNIGGEQLSKEQVKQQAMHFQDAFLGSAVHVVRGTDAGRDAWYFVLLRGPESRFKQCLDDPIIHLEDHGEILESAFGKDPGDDVTNAIEKRFGLADVEASPCAVEMFVLCVLRPKRTAAAAPMAMIAREPGILGVILSFHDMRRQLSLCWRNEQAADEAA